MRLLLTLIIFGTFSFVNAQNINTQVTKSKGYKTLLEKKPHLKLSDFKFSSTESLNLLEKPVEYPYTWSEYYPLDKLLEKELYYSGDKIQFVDIFSGGCYIEDNEIRCDSGATPILLGNKKKKTIHSIYLKSSSERIIDVVWIDHYEFYLLKEWYFDEKQYELQKINLKDKTVSFYKLKSH